MASKWLAFSGVALILLMVFAAGSPADARSGGHGGHGFSGARSFGGGGGQLRSYGGGQSLGRSQFRPPANFGNQLRLRSQAGTSTNFGQGQQLNKRYNYKEYNNYKGYNKGYAWKYPGKHDGKHRRHRRVFVGVPIFYGGDYYYYYGDCDWLRRRALATGSSYWWDRYNACLYEGY